VRLSIQIHHGPIARIATYSICLVGLSLLSGCALAELAEFAELGAVEGGAAAALGVEAASLAEIADAGLVVRGLSAGGVELAAEGSLGSGPLRGSLSSLASRSGLTLATEEGAVTISGSHLLLTEDGAVSLRSASGRLATVGRLDRSVLYEIGPGRSLRPVGRLSATSRFDNTTALSSPNTRAVVRYTLRAGTKVDVMRVSGSWYEVRLGSGPTAWVPAASMLTSIALAAGGSPQLRSSDSARDDLDRLLRQAQVAGEARRSAPRQPPSNASVPSADVRALRQKIDLFLRGGS
jgi:hypothetical protein